jgi:DNA-binding MarR family transcriptional regulator
MTQLQISFLRDTSIQAYHELKATGKLSALQSLVLDALRKCGPMSGREIERATGINGAWKRCSELQRMGYVTSTEKRTCTVTGKQVYVWSAK